MTSMDERSDVVRLTVLSLLELVREFKEFGVKIPPRVMRCKKTTFEELLRILLSKQMPGLLHIPLDFLCDKVISVYSSPQLVRILDV